MLKIVFMGTPTFSVPILEALIEKYDVIGVVTQPDKKVGRKQEIVYSPVKECALKHNIKVFQPVKIRTEYEEIMNLNPDIIITAAYGQLVGMKLLNSPKYRSINVHASLLPKYRGGAPIHEAIKNGEKETGVSIMYMEKAMDAGDILGVKKVPILDSDNCGTMFEKLSYAGRDLLMEVLPLLIDGKIEPIKQNEEDATFAYNVTKEDAANLVSSLDSINGSLIWVAFVDQMKEPDLLCESLVERPENEIRVRLRSRFVSINEVGAKYRGGGHLQAAGATIYSLEEMNSMWEELDTLLKEYKENNKEAF